MVAFLVIVLILDGILLSAVVLLQSGKGGGLAAVGGGASTDNFIGGRQAATLLTRTTWISATVFLVLSLFLSVMSSRGTQAPESILQQQFQQEQQAVPQPLELPGSEAPAGVPGLEGGEPAGTQGAGATGDAGTTQP